MGIFLYVISKIVSKHINNLYKIRVSKFDGLKWYSIISNDVRTAIVNSFNSKFYGITWTVSI